MNLAPDTLKEALPQKVAMPQLNSQSAPPFSITTEMYEGPIDLLLHLVKKHELPIERLSLALVCEQYLHELQRLQHLDMDVLAEYLVVASSLLSIKSVYLVGGNEPVLEVTEEEVQVEGAEEELLRRMREAAQYREGAALLALRDTLGVDVFATGFVGKVSASDSKILGQHNPMKLGLALRRLLERRKVDAAVMKIEFDPISVAQRMKEIPGVLEPYGSNGMTFEGLVIAVCGELFSVPVAITCFVAILELCRQGRVVLRQDETFGEIMIALVVIAEVRADFTETLDDQRT